MAVLGFSVPTVPCIPNHLIGIGPETKSRVELGECANEWRGFKFWSKDQKPRTESKIICHACKGKGYFFTDIRTNKRETCGYCDGTGYQEERNPLLEEYVDGLHFVLELGLEFSFDTITPYLVHVSKPLDMYLRIYKITTTFYTVQGREAKEFYYGELVSNYLGLGKSLGLTEEQIEQAYYEKNKINHDRQTDGY